MRTVKEIKADIASCDSSWIDSALCRSLRCELYETILGDISLGRIESICAAEKEGRCKVLPCKVGDTFYYPYAGRVIPKRITQYREILRKSEAIDRWYCLEFSNDETFDADDIGKTVFLTRAEAEKALEGKK